MSLIPEWAPNIHPLIVHLPIGIILLAVLMNIMSFLLSNDWWDEMKSTILYGIGILSVIAAYYSGNIAADSVFIPADSQTVLNNHADWAWWTMWFLGAYLFLRILFHYLKLMNQKIIRIIAFITVLPGIFFLYKTGDQGAKMVFGYGVGTGQLIQQKESASAYTDSLSKGKSTFIQKDTGSWSWEMGSKGVSTLLSHFQWLEGTPSDLNPFMVSDSENYMLKLTSGEKPNFLVEKSSFQNVQVDYYLDLSGFEGSLSLVNHVQDIDNYDYVTLNTEGIISQGRVEDGSKKVFAKEPYSATGMLFIRTVGNGTHFRAYINKEMAVHGHGDAPDPGKIGLKIDGQGSILIDKMIVTQL
ncbi:DUF2231 domain-containing protein [Fodinibius saliphilus]|uniref:DUF2231 domain-containing protein n=1 Tax=Fodinibius saliphilus TaxID=1920650 RepID=UPI001109F45E|nr:DUF2231 domain-containing protein [Fodinibius saliphilus]